MWPNPQETAEILNEKLHFLCSVIINISSQTVEQIRVFTKFTLLKFIHFHSKTRTKQIIVFSRRRLGKSLIWQNFSAASGSDFNCVMEKVAAEKVAQGQTGKAAVVKTFKCFFYFKDWKKIWENQFSVKWHKRETSTTFRLKIPAIHNS